jgi:THO complex subunit 4
MLKDLFGRIGPVSALSLVYDRAGRSEGVAYVTYERLADAHESVREFDGANAKGQPIRLTLVPGRRERPTERNTLFDRVERPERDSRSLSPGGEEGTDGSRRRGRRSDVSKPVPDGIDRYVPGSRQRSPRRGGGGGRRTGRDGRDNRGRNERGGRRTADGRPRKTQEELDQEMEDYWGGQTAATETAEKQPDADAAQPQAAPAPTATPATAAAPAAADDDIDMIE